MPAGGVAKSIEVALEFIVRAVVEESHCASARCGVVDYFGHHGAVFAEVKLVAYTYLAGRFHEYIPQLVVGIEFAEQKYLNTGAGFLLVAIEKARETPVCR